MLSPDKHTDERQSELVTEAIAIANLLDELGVNIDVRLDTEELLFSLTDQASAGAIDLMSIATRRFQEDDDFREDMIQYVGSVGAYLAEAPGHDAGLADTSAENVFEYLRSAGLVIALKPVCDKPSTRPHLSFELRQKKIDPSAHLLMMLVRDKYEESVPFANDLRAAVDGYLSRKAAGLYEY